MNLRWRVAFTLLLVGIGASNAPAVEQDVHMFRGVVGYWPHAADMKARMSQRGYCAYTYCHCQETGLADEVAAQVRQGVRRSVNLVGYSYGAAAAVQMACDLGEQGIWVDRLVLIECYNNPEIPPNVRYCVNVYESRPLDPVNIFRGTPARAMNPSTTVLVDIDIACARGWEAVRENNHFTMADDPRVQDFVARQFPDLRLQTSCDMAPPVQPAPIGIPLTQHPSQPAPMPLIQSASYESANSTEEISRSQPLPVLRTNPFASYRQSILR